MINANTVGPLVHLLQAAEFDISIRKEAARAISNATSGGTHDQIKYDTCSPLFFILMFAFMQVISNFIFLMTHHLSDSLGPRYCFFFPTKYLGPLVETSTFIY